jgi:hypothetical protein
MDANEIFDTMRKNRGSGHWHAFLRTVVMAHSGE